MKTKHRWLNSVIKEAANTDIKMPWARGEQKTQFKTRAALRSENKSTANS